MRHALQTVPVYAQCLREDHLPVIDGMVAEVVRIIDLREWRRGTDEPLPGDGKAIEVQWVPEGACFDVKIRESSFEPEAEVPCVRRADWARVREAARSARQARQAGQAQEAGEVSG